MIRNLMNRRRSEDARVERFLHAIDLSARYSVNPTWELQRVPDDTEDQHVDEQLTGPVDWRTDTVQLPRIILTAGAAL